jgi:hypothetical protein
VGFYKQVLPLRLVLVGKSKGRTIKALRERVDTLSLHADTRSMGGVLNGFHSRVKMAHNWRGGRIVHTLSDEAFKADAEILQYEIPNLPAEVCQHALQRTFSRQQAEQRWVAYVKCSNPFRSASDTTAFNLMDPMMKYIPRVDRWRLAVCQRSLIEAHICAWVRTGEEKSSQLLDMLAALATELGNEDPFEMDKLNASFYNELLQVSDGLTSWSH